MCVVGIESLYDRATAYQVSLNAGTSSRTVILLCSLFVFWLCSQLFFVQVVSIVPYGAFVNIEGNIDGLVHISEMAVGRVDSVEDVCQVRAVLCLSQRREFEATLVLIVFCDVEFETRHFGREKK